MDTSWATALYRARYSVSQKSAVIVKLLLSSYCIQFCFNFMSNLKLSYVTKQSFALLLINDRYFVYSYVTWIVNAIGSAIQCNCHLF